MKQLYARLGGSYEDVKRRLMKDALIERFVLRFPDDPSFAELHQAMNAHDVSAAFAAAHTLKGVALTLGFDRLGAAASALTEALRTPPQPIDWPQMQLLCAPVEAAYAEVIDTIHDYSQASNNG